MGKEGRIADPEHLLEAMRLSIQQGGRFLLHRMAPYGPILQEPNLSYVHKVSWGMYAAGVDHEVLARMLDWVREKALQPNGDFYIPGEGPEYRDMQRVYRTLTFGKVAAWIGHPLIRAPQVLDRILQYQHQPSGGVFNYIGEDPTHVEEQATLGSLNTSFFGHLMVALDLKEPAIAAGEWIRGLVEANREHMAGGRMYTQRTPGGDLVMDVAPGEKILKVVDNRDPKQEFWHVGTSMAYLTVLYDTMRRRWGWDEAKAQPYLRAAMVLLNFEDTMPLETYLWASKCKVGWGAGELLRILVTYGKGTGADIEKAYRVCERVAVFTFMNNQLPNGGWPCFHYPLSEQIPEIQFSYVPLKGMVYVPDRAIPHSKTIFLPGEEITGEFVGEMKSIEEGVAAMCVGS